MAKQTPAHPQAGQACHDCGQLVWGGYCVPATPREQAQMANGLFVNCPPLCYTCWAKRTH